MKKPLTIIAVIGAVLGLAFLFRDQVSRQGSEPDARAPTAAQKPVPLTPVPAPAAAQPSPSSRPGAPPTNLPPAPAPTPRPTTDSVATSVSVEQDADAAALLKRAAAAYATVNSLRADFAQWQDNPLLGRRTNSRGTVFQRQPDRFLMRFTQPEGDVIVSDGEFFWLYYPSVDAKQVLRSKAADVGGLDLQSQFIGDPTRRFSYADQGKEDVSGRPARVLTLTPKQPQGYKSLKVWIDQRDHLVRRFELTMENGVVQHFDLSNLQVNPALSNDLFRFTPPAGARIIDR